jgi:hypothetical protein
MENNMTNVQHGEVEWGDSSSGSSNKENNKDLYLKLEQGSNKVRILTKPQKYMTHKGVKKVGEQGFGRKIPCSKENGSCPLCDKGLKAQTRYLVGVLDRKTNAYKVLDISYGVFQDIKNLNADDIWGDPTKYDISLIVDKNAAPAKYYTVQPIPHKPLSAAEQVIRDNVDMEYLKKKVEPLQSESVQKIIDKVFGPDAEFVIPKPKDDAPVTKAKGVPSMTDTSSDSSDDLNGVFPNFDSN